MPGTVALLRPGGVTLGNAANSYLATIDRPETRSTCRQYSYTLRRLTAALGPDAPVAGVDDEAVNEWVEETWGDRTPNTYNRGVAVLRSAWQFWIGCGWASADPTAPLRRRKVVPDWSTALTRVEIRALMAEAGRRCDTVAGRGGIGLRDHALWCMLYDTAARASEVLRLNAQDLELGSRRARVTRKGGAVEWVMWTTATATLLPRLLKGRTRGPVFLTRDKSRRQLAALDMTADGYGRLSYRQAEDRFGAVSEALPFGPVTLHKLRIAALTHLAEDGAALPMLMAISGHQNADNLLRYTRPSTEALMAFRAERDPARR